MTDHTTHHYDCGCQSAAYEGQLDALRAEVEELRHQRTRVLEMHYEFNPDGHARGLCHGCDYSWPCPTVGVYRTAAIKSRCGASGCDPLTGCPGCNPTLQNWLNR